MQRKATIMSRGEAIRKVGVSDDLDPHAES